MEDSPDSPLLPLIEAIGTGDVDKVKELLEAGHLPETADQNGWTAVHECVDAQHKKALIALLDHSRENRRYLTSLKTLEGETPLIIACKEDEPSLDIISILICAGADPNLMDRDKAPLHYICHGCRDFEIVKMLVENGANPNLQDIENGFIPFHLLFEDNYSYEMLEERLVKFLVEVSDVDILDSRLESALFKAAFGNFVGAVKLILEKSTKTVNQMTEDWITPLSAAAYIGNLSLVKMLIEVGADIHLECGTETPYGCISERKFLPIHSSLDTIEVFKFFLNATDPDKLLPNDSYYRCQYHFATYVLFYSEKAEFFETLLDHKLPEANNILKISWVRNVIEFILRSKVLHEKLTLKRFQLFFKYYRNFEPDCVFEQFSCVMTDYQLKKNHEYLDVLSKMGISCSEMVSFSKRRIICLLTNWIRKKGKHKKTMKETLSRLKAPVLSLKQLSRVAARRAIFYLTEDDWEAYKMIRDSSLPSDVKQYLWYQKLD